MATIEEEEKDMIHSVMDLQHRLAKEVMVPRIDIRALPETATRKELIDLLRESGHTRVPIFQGSVDHIVGVVSAFAVLTDPSPETPTARSSAT
jgi:putative hemolysin